MIQISTHKGPNTKHIAAATKRMTPKLQGRKKKKKKGCLSSQTTHSPRGSTTQIPVPKVNAQGRRLSSATHSLLQRRRDLKPTRRSIRPPDLALLAIQGNRQREVDVGIHIPHRQRLREYPAVLAAAIRQLDGEGHGAAVHQLLLDVLEEVLVGLSALEGVRPRRGDDDVHVVDVQAVGALQRYGRDTALVEVGAFYCLSEEVVEERVDGVVVVAATDMGRQRHADREGVGEPEGVAQLEMGRLMWTDPLSSVAVEDPALEHGVGVEMVEHLGLQRAATQVRSFPVERFGGRRVERHVVVDLQAELCWELEELALAGHVRHGAGRCCSYAGQGKRDGSTHALCDHGASGVCLSHCVQESLGFSEGLMVCLY